MKRLLFLLVISFGVQQLNAQLAVTINQVNVLCNGQCNGTATAVPTGGTPPYTYAWNPSGATTQSISGLCAGSYTVTVTDALANNASATVTIVQPSPITLSFTATTVSCNGMCDGAATATISGGTPAYTYLWSNSYNFPTITSLCAGTYSCTVTDANGCVANGAYVITQPAPLPAAITPAYPTICAGSSITLTGSGGMTYSWTPTMQFGSSIIVTPSVTSTYTLTVTDAMGCTGTAVSTIYVDQLPVVTSSSIEAGCNHSDGSGTVNVAGNAPFTFNWTPNVSSTGTATNIPVGTYVIDVMDNSGCVTTNSLTVGDSCNFVWPGDANEDAVADNNDILAIGIANGATGTTRANATTNWIGQPSVDWGQTLLSGTDYKFVDCNGDGTIDPTDTNAVVQNFGLMHNMRQGGIPVYDATLPDLTITMGQNTLASNAAGILTIELGSSSIPVSNLYGLAFTLNFDPNQIDASSFRMNENGSWMGTVGTDLMGVVMNAGNGTGSVEVALTRLDHQNINGFGNLATVGFMTTGDLVGTGNTQNVNFTISNVTVISANETPQTVNTINDSVLVEDPGVLGISANENPQTISAYPNPFDESVQLILPASANGMNCVITLTDACGRVILTQQTGNAKSTIIKRGQLEAGIYFCTVRSQGQIIGNTKLIVN